MSEMEEREKAGLLFRVSQLHYMIVDRNRELMDVHYPKVSGNSNAFSEAIRELDSEYTDSLRSQERQYFDAVKLMELDDLRSHVAKMENRLGALDGIIPEGQSGYIRFQSVERISTYHVDLYFNLNSSEIRMVFEIETISNLGSGGTIMHRIEKRYPARCRVLDRTPIVDDPVLYNGYYYYPEPFPKGTWTLLGTGYKSDLDMQSVIRTDAKRQVMSYDFQKEIRNEDDEIIHERVVEEKGMVPDEGYQIHGGGYTGDVNHPSDIYDPEDNNLYTNSTWGCIRMNNDDVREIIPYVDAAKSSNGRRQLHVN